MMGSYQWLLCLVVIGLASRRVSSMNDKPLGKNASQRTVPSNTSPNDENKQHDEVKDRDGQSAVTYTSANVGRNLTSFNGSAALVTDLPRISIDDAARSETREQSHSRHHVRRSKSNRRETKTNKSRASLTKSNTANANLSPFSFEHAIVSLQDTSHGLNHSTDSMKHLDPTPKPSSTYSPSTFHAVTSSNEDSAPKSFTRSLNSTGSSVIDNPSSRITASSGSTENWNDFSSSSNSGFSIDEKLSSIELMAFTFDNVDDVRISATSPNEIIEEVKNPHNSIAMSSLRKMKSVQKLDKSIDKKKSQFTEVNSGVINPSVSIQGSRNEIDDNSIVDSVHSESSRNAERTNHVFSTPAMKSRDNGTRDNSVIQMAEATESPKNSRNTSSKGSKADDKLQSTNSQSDSNVSRVLDEEYSWESVNDSLNHISLTEVADNLKSVNLSKSRGSYFYSTYTLSENAVASSTPKIQIPDNVGASAKHSRSLKVPNVPHSSKKLGLSMSSKPNVKFFDNSLPSSASLLTEEAEQPFRLTIPLDIRAIIKASRKNNLVTEDLELPGPSTLKDLSTKKISLEVNDEDSKDGPPRLVLDLNPLSSSTCSTDSSTERLESSHRHDRRNPSDQRHIDHVTVSVSANNISAVEQCLTRLAPALNSLNIADQPETPAGTLDSSITPLNSDNMSNASIRSNGTEAENTRSAPFEIDDQREAQSLLPPSFVILDNFGPVIYEALAPAEEVAVIIEAETTTPRHNSSGLSDFEEHCDAPAFDVFIPSVNSRETIAKEMPVEGSLLVHREPGNLNITTDDSLYIMEGFEFLENDANEDPELVDEFNHRSHVFSDYGETETNSKFPELDDHSSGMKVNNQIEFEAKSQFKQEASVIASPQRERNNDDHYSNGPWWLNDKTQQKREQVVNNNVGSEQRTVSIASAFSSPQDSWLLKDVASQNTESDNRTHHNLVLPTVYIFIGIGIIMVGCSIWCSKAFHKKQPEPSKLKYYIQPRRRATNTVV